MTRSERKVAELKTAGVTPIVVDVFDAPALSRAMTAVCPEIVIHQLTDLRLILNRAAWQKALLALRVSASRERAIWLRRLLKPVSAELSPKAWLVGSTRLAPNPILKMLRWISPPKHLNLSLWEGLQRS